MPVRPKKPCSAPGCPNFAVKNGRCALHQRKPWEGTVKNHGFKSGWEWSRIKAEHLRQYPYCQVAGCGRVAEEVHQPVKGSRGGLVSLCKEHHGRITQAAARAGRQRK